MHFLLFYETAPDYLARRGAHRGPHLELARAAAARGELLMGGAFGDPPEGALLLFQGDGPEPAQRFAAADPYVLNGLVRSWKVLPWTTVAGPLASAPIAP